MLEHIKAPNPKLKAFVQHTAKQFLACSVQSGIVKPNELIKAEEMLEQHLQTVELFSAQKFKNVSASVDVFNPLLNIREDFAKALETCQTFDDESLEHLKSILFHEFTHHLQKKPNFITEVKNKDVTLIAPYEVGYMTWEEKKLNTPHTGTYMNELATSIAEELLMHAYYKNIKGSKNAMMTEYTMEHTHIIDGKDVDFLASVPHAVDDPLTHVADKAAAEKNTYNLENVTKRGRGHSTGYTPVRAVAEKMFKATGISMLEFARGSTVFGGKEKEAVAQKYKNATGEEFNAAVEDFDNFYQAVRYAQDNKRNPNRAVADAITQRHIKKRTALISKFDNIAERDK